MTWNLWWRFGDWERRFQAILETLRDEDPDVCGLQEIWDEDGRNSAAMLAEALGMHWAWIRSPRSDRWRRRLGVTGVDIGNAVLSRWPIADTAHARLPTGGVDDEGRTVLWASIDGPSGRIPFFTTQLNSGPAHSAVRREQVAAIAPFVATHGTGGYPPMLTGDFNAQPESDEIRLMEGHLTAPVVAGLVVVDAWRYAEPDDRGLTWNRANPHVAATLEPSARIDYVFVGPPGRDGRGHVRSVGLVGTEPRNGVWPSDHAGVRVDLRG